MATCRLAASISEAGLTLVKMPIVHSLQASQEILCRRAGMNGGIEEITQQLMRVFRSN